MGFCSEFFFGGGRLFWLVVDRDGSMGELECFFGLYVGFEFIGV